MREVITPAQAKALLSQSTFNRPLSKEAIMRYARAMREGRFTVTTDAIGLDTNGRLINGHHRLHAVIKADTSVEMLIERNLPPESWDNTDTGRPRRMADILMEDKNLVADAQLVRNLIAGDSAKADPDTIRDILDWWAPVQDALKPIRGSKASSAPVRVGFGLRWAVERTVEARAYVLDQYENFLFGKPMSAAVNQMFRVMAKAPTFGSYTARHDGALRVFYCTAYYKRDRTNLLGESRIDSIDAAVRAVLSIMPEAFAIGPAADWHVYDWQGAEKARGAKAVAIPYVPRTLARSPTTGVPEIDAQLDL